MKQSRNQNYHDNKLKVRIFHALEKRLILPIAGMAPAFLKGPIQDDRFAYEGSIKFMGHTNWALDYSSPSPTLNSRRQFNSRLKTSKQLLFGINILKLTKITIQDMSLQRSPRNMNLKMDHL
jgi:hypothetical protein